jgi:hypothetical protein
MELSRRVPIIALDSSASDSEDDSFASLVDLKAAAQQQQDTKNRLHVVLGDFPADVVAGWVASVVALLLYVGLFGCLGGLVLWPWRAELLGSDTEGSGIELAMLWSLFGVLSVCWAVGLVSYFAAACTSNVVGPKEIEALFRNKVATECDPGGCAKDECTRDEHAEDRRAEDGHTKDRRAMPAEAKQGHVSAPLNAHTFPPDNAHLPNASPLIATPEVLRWCRKCRAPKPPRSHHCSVCNRCILKMDHHCPWVNNCVGFHSHGHYVRFIGWTLAALFTALTCLAWRLVSLRGRWAMPVGSALGLDVWELLGLVVCLVGSSVVSVMLGALAVGQGLQISAGHTTIEGLEWAQAQRDLPDQEVPFPFDLGVAHNWALVVGVQNSRVMSLLPLPEAWNPLAEGDAECSERLGVAFRVRPDALMNGRWPLPSKDPLLRRDASHLPPINS